MIPLALAHLTVLETAPPALFDLAAQAGYQHVGIRILPAVPGAVSYPLDPPTVIAWRRRMAEAGVGVHDVEFIPLTPAVRVADYEETIALAGELGARRINVSGDDTDLERLAGNFGALCDIAAKAGLGVDLEFMRFRIVGDLSQAMAVVERAARPNGRLLIDALHLSRSGGTAAMLATTPAQALGSVQLCDARLADPTDARLADEARQGRLIPGDGELPLADIMNALPAGIPVGVEVPGRATYPELRPWECAAKAATATRLLLAGWKPARSSV